MQQSAVVLSPRRAARATSALGRVVRKAIFGKTKKKRRGFTRAAKREALIIFGTAAQLTLGLWLFRWVARLSKEGLLHPGILKNEWMSTINEVANDVDRQLASTPRRRGLNGGPHG